MAKYYSGQDGKLFVDSAGNSINQNEDVAKVRSWSFTLNTAVLETVSLGDFDRTIIPGISSVTGSCSVYYYAESTSGSHNSGRLSSQILSAALPRSGNTPQSSERPKLRFRFQVDSKHYIDIKAVITSVSMQNSVGEIMAAEINFEGDGIPVESTY